MFDNEQNEGENTIELYVDPTPPIPALQNLTEHQVFLKETELSARTLDEDVVSIIWELQLKRLYYVKGIPHLDQQDYGKGKVNNGNMYCAPTASAACLKWWAANGYPGLTQDLAGNGLTDTQLVEGLATAEGTSSVSGTAVPNLVSGLRNWINNRGLGLTVTGPSAVTPTSVRDEVENCKEDVLIGVYWNTGGGHRVTVNSIANFTNADGSTTIDLMDPWEGGIVNITMQPNGNITWPGKAGVQASGNMVTVSPTKPRIPWILIGEGPSLVWDPTTLQPGLYFLKCTMTDKVGNRGSSQIVARVGSPFLPPLLDPPRLDPTGKTLMLQWHEVEPGPLLGYAVEFSEDHLKWTPVTDPSPQMSATLLLPAVQKGYYRIWKGPLAE